jgi:hypothetical protein
VLFYIASIIVVIGCCRPYTCKEFLNVCVANLASNLTDSGTQITVCIRVVQRSPFLFKLFCHAILLISFRLKIGALGF